VTALIVHCLPCDDTGERWRAAVAALACPPGHDHPSPGEPTPVCDLCLFDAVNASIRDRHPITVLPLETAP
jgi:hypothetical protein